MFLLLLAALSGVDRSQLEAAAIDGAGWWRMFFRIVLPAIWPVMAVAILIAGWTSSGCSTSYGRSPKVDRAP